MSKIIKLDWLTKDMGPAIWDALRSVGTYTHVGTLPRDVLPGERVTIALRVGRRRKLVRVSLDDKYVPQNCTCCGGFREITLTRKAVCERGSK